MSWIDDAIRDFGHGMGMENLSLNEQGVLCLSFETRGDLYFEKTEDAIILYLAKEIPEHDPEILKKAIQTCHYREELPMEVNPGIGEGNRLVFLIRITDKEVSLPRLQEGVDLLLRMHEIVI